MTKEQRNHHNEQCLQAYQREQGKKGDELPFGEELRRKMGSYKALLKVEEELQHLRGRYKQPESVKQRLDQITWEQ